MLKIPMTLSCRRSGTVSDERAPTSPGQEARVLLRVRADVAAARGPDVSADPVALRQRINLEFDRLLRQAAGHHHFQPARAVIDQADAEVVELQEVAAELHDPGLEQAEPLEDVHPADGLGFEPHQLAARLINQIELLAEASVRRDIPDDHRDGVDSARLPAVRAGANMTSYARSPSGRAISTRRVASA